MQFCGEQPFEIILLAFRHITVLPLDIYTFSGGRDNHCVVCRFSAGLFAEEEGFEGVEGVERLEGGEVVDVECEDFVAYLR